MAAQRWGLKRPVLAGALMGVTLGANQSFPLLGGGWEAIPSVVIGTLQSAFIYGVGAGVIVVARNRLRGFCD